MQMFQPITLSGRTLESEADRAYVMGTGDHARMKGDDMAITPIHEMSDEDRLAVFDRFCDKTRTSTIAKKTGAVSGTFGDMPEIALDDIGGYGWQRRFNDGNGGAEVSTDDKIANGVTRFLNHLKGVVTARGPAMSDHESIMHKIARADWIASLPKAERSAARGLDTSETRVKTTARIAMDPDKYDEAATVQVFVDAAMAKAKADAYAVAMTKIAENKADAAKLQATLDELDKS